MSALRPWTAQVVDRRLAGIHRIRVTPPGGAAVDVTFFRGIPTQLTSYSFADPFGPASAEISFPQVTVFDALGGPGLEWLVPEANIDILWQDITSPADLDIDITSLPEDGTLHTLWEGYIASLAYSADENGTSVSVQCKGALFQVDNFKSYPSYPTVPIPYEVLIRDSLDPKLFPSLRTTKLQPIVWPPGWSVKVPDDPATEALRLSGATYLRPYGVSKGQLWTGLTTRNTGSWNAMLTGLIQTLLALMFTPDGSQWTLMLDSGRKPVLKVRQILFSPDQNTLEVWVGQPGVTMNLTEDWTQIANVYYGQGNDIGGVTFSNAQVSSDGRKTSYAPFAAQRQVHPATSAVNKWFTPAVMRHETQITFDAGLTPAAAAAVALFQLQRNSHPGFTGSISLKVDPVQAGETFSRFRIASGMQVLIHGFRSMPAGLLVHIAQVSINVSESSVELTVDSKFRDLLTVTQVRERARDALDPLRTMKLAVGSYSPLVNDLRKPWSYAHGSGIIPSAPSGEGPNATPLFTRYATGSDVFPWTRLTTKYPPKNHQSWYIEIPPPSSNFNKNWANVKTYAIPCLFAEQGTIRLTQFAAYDRNGNVMPIRFHVSIYSVAGVNINTMPMVPKDKDTPGYLKSLASHGGQHYPFFPGAFESTDRNGAPKGAGDLTGKDASLVTGWGNYYQPAGYYPNLYTDIPHPHPTGLLLDETTWGFDTTQDSNFQQRPNPNFKEGPNAGLLFVMIYAEANTSSPVYFLGRCFRQEPGTT